MGKTDQGNQEKQLATVRTTLDTDVDDNKQTLGHFNSTRQGRTTRRLRGRVHRGLLDSNKKRWSSMAQCGRNQDRPGNSLQK